MEQKEFYSIDEAGKILGRNRATIYNRINLLGIETHKFNMDRKAYIAAPDLERIKTVFAKPWTGGEKEIKPKRPVGRPRKRRPAQKEDGDEQGGMALALAI